MTLGISSVQKWPWNTVPGYLKGDSTWLDSFKVMPYIQHYHLLKKFTST